MATISRWLAPAVLAVGLGAAAIAPLPAMAQSGDNLVRVLVDVADVVLRGGVPYYRNGDYGYDDRLVAGRDRYGRVVYYRMVPRDGYRAGPPYGNANGYYRNGPGSRATAGRVSKCNKHGKCKVEYYDPRYDRDGRYGYDRDRRYDGRYDPRYDNRYYGYDRDYRR